MAFQSSQTYRQATAAATDHDRKLALSSSLALFLASLPANWRQQGIKLMQSTGPPVSGREGHLLLDALFYQGDGKILTIAYFDIFKRFKCEF